MVNTNRGGSVLPSTSVAVQNPNGEPEVPNHLMMIGRRLQKNLEQCGMIPVQDALRVTSDLLNETNETKQKRILASIATIEMYNGTWMVVGLEHPNDPPSGETEGFQLTLR